SRPVNWQLKTGQQLNRLTGNRVRRTENRGQRTVDRFISTSAAQFGPSFDPEMLRCKVDVMLLMSHRGSTHIDWGRPKSTESAYHLGQRLRCCCKAAYEELGIEKDQSQQYLFL